MRTRYSLAYPLLIQKNSLLDFFAYLFLFSSLNTRANVIFDHCDTSERFIKLNNVCLSFCQKKHACKSCDAEISQRMFENHCDPGAGNNYKRQTQRCITITQITL